MMNQCRHTDGWDSDRGENRCRTCGTRRFMDYGALRPRELPPVVKRPLHDRIRADRAAAIVISRTVRHISRWGRSDAEFGWTAA
ncbi:DUF6255 family natural product biosynthesis protein [Streptomyces luteireticuli]